ncbi:MAG TPA: hypothetical protein VMN56_19460 [Casimicrobiaceae bacterium]|nr:hypothetical protein [Casimicrobiaceae bacterium]
MRSYEAPTPRVALAAAAFAMSAITLGALVVAPAVTHAQAQDVLASRPTTLAAAGNAAVTAHDPKSERCAGPMSDD